MSFSQHTCSARSQKIALTNVRVFDGHRLCEPGTVVIDGAQIGNDSAGAHEIDGQGGILIPGLIDTHVHLLHAGHLEQLSKYGVTTALDMAMWPVTRVNSLRAKAGTTDIRSCGIPAVAPGSGHSRIPGMPDDASVASPADAERFVIARVSEGSDYIKIISDIPGHDQATLNALVTAAYKHSKLTIAHTSTSAAFAMAQAAKVDIVTHVPLDIALSDKAIELMLADHRIAIPTLTMMKAVVTGGKKPGADYAHSHESVSAMYRAGVPILAGTDANEAPGVPATVRYGESIHEELELLVDAGLSNLDALRAATSLPAKYFGLNDRGIIEPGRRADLVLLSGDPLKDIHQTRSIRRVWCGGIEVALS